MEEDKSYKNIVKTTGLIGLVHVFKIIFGVISNKVVAVVIGTEGFGIYGLYQTYIEMVSSFSTLGIDQSGVRQIAKKSDDELSTAKTIWIFKRILLVISIFTSILSAVFSKAISRSLFATEEYYVGIIIISFVVLCNGVSRGQISILNGLRQMKSMALSQVIGAGIGSLATVVMVLLLGVNGIPFYLLAIGLTAVLTTWWYVRKLNLKTVVPTTTEVKGEIKTLLILGLGFSMAGLVAAVMTYLSRVYLSDTFNISAVGIYIASWTISNLYIGTILNAMGVDFMPRLMKVVDDHKQMNKLINEQMELGVLITSIGVVGILIFSSLVLSVFYSSEFAVGASIIRWQVLGVGMRVLGFPLGFAIMAKNKPVTYVIVQSSFYLIDYLLLILCSNIWGFDGLGINYFLGYFAYIFFTWFVCFRLIGFKFSKLLFKIVLIAWSFILIAWVVSSFLTTIYSWIIGSGLIIIMGIWIIRYLDKYMSISVIGILRNKLKK